MASHFLSKSLFIRGCQCHKSLWLQKYRPELKDEISDQQQAVFQSGTDIGILAQQLFPHGIEIPYDGLTYQQQIENTRQAIADGVKTIYEATFQHEGVFVKADILHKGRKGWEIYEVKASTGVKDVHISDAALQYHVISGAGLHISKVCLVHINNQYIRKGNLDVKQLFTAENITDEVVAYQQEVAKELQAQLNMLAQDMPTTDIGPHCDTPYPCDFSGHCWAHIPEDSVFDLRGRGVDKFELYKQGIVKQSEIPLDLLNSSQRLQVESTLNRQNFIDTDKVKQFISDLWYPLCFLDFETVNPSIPPFDGCRPYGRMPFQFSLHIQNSPDAELQHFEYLAQPFIDPRSDILNRLLELIPQHACIIAWNQAFEIGVMRELADLYPKHKDQVDNMISNFRDLMQPFRSRDIHFWKAKGSYSIKPNLPLLVPELSYEKLDGVANGGDAMDAYYMMQQATTTEDLEKIRKNLLEYCKPDTEAMVRILDRIREMAFN